MKPLKLIPLYESKKPVSIKEGGGSGKGLIIPTQISISFDIKKGKVGTKIAIEEVTFGPYEISGYENSLPNIRPDTITYEYSDSSMIKMVAALQRMVEASSEYSNKLTSSATLYISGKYDGIINPGYAPMKYVKGDGIIDGDDFDVDEITLDLENINLDVDSDDFDAVFIPTVVATEEFEYLYDDMFLADHIDDDGEEDEHWFEDVRSNYCVREGLNENDGKLHDISKIKSLFSGKNLTFITNLKKGECGVVANKDGGTQEVCLVSGEIPSKLSDKDSRKFSIKTVK